MTFLSNSDIAIAQQVLAWAEHFLAAPHSDMTRRESGKPEAICPFVKPALDGNSFYVSVHREVNGYSAEAIVSIAQSQVRPFKMAPPFDERGKMRKALVLVFPEIPAGQMAVLDVAFGLLKPGFVEDGMMITQCYPGCDVSSVHNPALAVYTSPHPLLAMRYMAVHDVLFVGEDERWFQEYSIRFGQRFREPASLEPWEHPLLEAYHRARERFVGAP